MGAAYKTGGRMQPCRERERAENIGAARAANAALDPLPEAPPDWLTDEAARNAWRELRPNIMEEVARRADSHYFALICTMFSRAVAGDTSPTAMNTLANMMERMGLNPSGRRRLALQYGIGQGETPKSAARFARFDDPPPGIDAVPFAAPAPAEPGEAAPAPAKPSAKAKAGAKKAASRTRKAPARDNAGRFARFDAQGGEGNEP